MKFSSDPIIHHSSNDFLQKLLTTYPICDYLCLQKNRLLNKIKSSGKSSSSSSLSEQQQHDDTADVSSTNSNGFSRNRRTSYLFRSRKSDKSVGNDMLRSTRGGVDRTYLFRTRKSSFGNELENPRSIRGGYFLRTRKSVGDDFTEPRINRGYFWRTQRAMPTIKAKGNGYLLPDPKVDLGRRKRRG